MADFRKLFFPFASFFFPIIRVTVNAPLLSVFKFHQLINNLFKTLILRQKSAFLKHVI